MTRKYRIVSFFMMIALSAFSQGAIDQLPEWKEGYLDIHHINTGRGDAAYVIFPDGTTMLVDAGDMSETRPRTLSTGRTAPLKPNTTKTAPEWIVDYIKQFAPKNKTVQLDYALITHYHDDHFGEYDHTRKISEKGGYALTGIMEVGHHIPIKKLLDRGSGYPTNLKSTEIQEAYSIDDEYQMINTLKHYWKFSDHHAKTQGLKHEEFVPGALDQIGLNYAKENFPNFSIRNIAVNGNVWTGEKTGYYSVFKEGEYPGENALSACIKISYGKFDYFTGGDIGGINSYGASDLNSMESHVAPVIGPVDVATLNHHGSRDSQNTYYVRTIRPRVWVQQNWSSDHPGDEVLTRLLSKELYPGERDIFSTVMLQANKDVIGSKLNNYKSHNGHVVVRVYNKGADYVVYVLKDSTEKREVLQKFGAYESR